MVQVGVLRQSGIMILYDFLILRIRVSELRLGDLPLKMPWSESQSICGEKYLPNSTVELN